MNKLLSKIMLMLILLAVASPSKSADVTITVNGRVVAKPCVVSTTSATVDLGQLYTFDLFYAGSVSPWQTVTLNLTDCPIGTSQVKATFSGQPDNTGNYYANQGGAGNIALQLSDTGGVNLPNGASKQIPVNYPAQTASFSLQVRAITVSGNSSQGTIQSTINVTYTYA
ncbi:fimbrial protein [Pantoea ananatis]|uniref:fimbrial protein n=1 Tax=Pantoea ananas TaxID=553 RepID=UPI000F87B60E|nr:type 1 fimbrial protein [Pantoea ananatis]RQN05297.1 type 1 fimbrial protein [Pantoea ananatis]